MSTSRFSRDTPLETPRFSKPSQSESSRFARPSSYGSIDRPSNDRPSSYGDRPSSYGDRPSSYGDRPSSYGDRPSSYGDRPSSYGSRPMSTNHKPSQPLLPATMASFSKKETPKINMDDFPVLGGKSSKSAQIPVKVPYSSLARDWEDKKKQEDEKRRLEKEKEVEETRLRKETEERERFLYGTTLSKLLISKKKETNVKELELDIGCSSIRYTVDETLNTKYPIVADEDYDEVPQEEDTYESDSLWNHRRNKNDLY